MTMRATEWDEGGWRPLRTGVVFGLTVTLLYAVCTVVWLAAPGLLVAFLNALFHGLDFTPLVARPGFAWDRFLGAAVVLFLCAFAGGASFGWLQQRVGV